MNCCGIGFKFTYLFQIGMDFEFESNQKKPLRLFVLDVPMNGFRSTIQLFRQAKEGRLSDPC